MNILVDELPTTALVDGAEYKLKTDFRNALSTILAFEDEELSNGEKIGIMVQNLFVEMPQQVTESVIEACQWFLNAGEDAEPTRNRRLYSFSKDAQLIYAAFNQTHGVNLQNAELHWWAFLSLFMDLGKDTTFVSLVGLRDRYYKGKATKEERQAIRNMGDAFHVPETDTRTLEEKETISAVMEAYKKAKAQRGK